MEDKDLKKEKNIATGVSSGIGAAVGVAVGNAFAQPADAATVDTHTSSELNSQSVQVPPSHPEPEPQPVPEPQPDPIPNPEPTPEVQVLSYETVTAEDGSQADVAVVAMNNQPAIIVDGDQDGMADVIAVDANMNGIIENEEIIDATGAGISMAPFKSALDMSTGDIAEVPDYVNDADIDDYMA